MRTLKILFVVTAILITGCSEENKKGKFKVTGNIDNIENQQIYLDQIYFDNRAPEILDTADIRNGKFELSSTAPEEALFRLRFEKNNKSFFFINDAPEIKFSTDINKDGIDEYSFSGKENVQLKKIMREIDWRQRELMYLDSALNASKAGGQSDSMIVQQSAKFENKMKDYRQFLLKSADTSFGPVASLFPLGFLGDLPITDLNAAINNISRRFPDHTGVKDMSNTIRSMAEAEKMKSMESSGPSVGSMAPDFTMNDVNGQPFSLSQLKGKYVLVDFWASWCGPCRMENPNVVRAYQMFKDKNFTVLGVSLDQSREKWLKAIKDDNLTWQQISDLQYWNTPVVSLYKFDGIPYNVLIDPEGKIIATGLRDRALIETLTNILK